MHSLLAFLLLSALPFWEAKPPEQWTNLELDLIFHNSPWAQPSMLSTRIGGEPEVFVYLASAKPMQEAEEERRRRRKAKSDPLAEDYRAWAAENQGKFIVLAVHVPTSLTFSEAEESKRMEKDSFLRVGRKRYSPVIVFPPSSTDEHLRFVFPREVRDSDKKMAFELYVPSVKGPYRDAEFTIKDLMYKGALAF